jgi:hypothetical protein
VAQTRAAGTWTAMAQARLPAPQQTSTTRAPSPAACTFSMAVRPSSSVSGRGTSARAAQQLDAQEGSPARFEAAGDVDPGLVVHGHRVVTSGRSS